MSKKNKRRRLDPRDMRSWDNDNHRMLARDEFIRNTPDLSAERLKCIESGTYAKTKFAEWGLFYIEGEVAPPEFPPFDPNLNIVKIPSTTVFRVYEDHQDRLKRDQQVVFVLDVKDVVFEHRDRVWRCTYTPYQGRKKRSKGKRSSKG